jgi:hypothetical protein
MEANCVCKKCGATAYSKCPACRTVYLSNEVESRLSWILKRNIVTHDTECGEVHWLEVSLHVLNPKETTVAGELKRLHKILDTMVKGEAHYPTIEQYACDHEWSMMKGCTSKIRCGHF